MWAEIRNATVLVDNPTEVTKDSKSVKPQSDDE